MIKNNKSRQAFSLAEALITLTIVSLILAATLPVITKKQNVTDSMWNYVGSGTGANSSIFYGLGDSQSAVIGYNSIPDSSFGSRLVIMTPLEDTSSGSDDTIRRSLIDFYQRTTTGISNIGRIAFDLGNNLAIGKNALINDTPNGGNNGLHNTAVGNFALKTNTIGYNNTAVGYTALLNSISGLNNSAFGRSSLNDNTTGSHNSVLGAHAMHHNTEGTFNTAVGTYTLAGYNSARITAHTGNNNTAVGYQALRDNIIGNNNVAVGGNSMRLNTNGYSNTAIGIDSLGANSESHTGNENMAGGHGALYSNTSGYNNTAVGAYSIMNSTSGYSNTALGYGTCIGINEGINNVCIGHMSGPTTDTSNQLFIDTSMTDAPLIGGDFASRSVTFNFPGAYGPISFGSGYDMSFTGGSDSIFRFINTGASSGHTSIGTYSSEFFTVYNNGAAVWSAGGYTSSDKRWKKNITPLKSSLENVLKLQGVNYYWKKKEFPKMPFNNKRQIGLIAQDVEKIYPELIFTDNEGYKNLDYSKMVPILIEAIKELYDKVIVIEKSHLSLSDARLKNIGKENKIGLEKILQIKVKEFTFKNSNDKRKHSGVIAQELQKFFPEAVLEGPGDDKHKSLLYIDTNEILFALVNSVKQLYTKVVNLAQRIDLIDKQLKVKDIKIGKLETELKIKGKSIEKLEREISSINIKLKAIEAR